MNRTRGVRANNTKFYNDQSVILNRVLPSLVHKYDTGQYYNSTAGETSLPFTAVRASNAMQFDPQGRLVWAPANMVINSSTVFTLTNAATSTLSAGVISPTGDSTYKLVANAAQSLTGNDALGGITAPSVTTVAGYTYCLSFYAKAAELAEVRVREPSVTGYRAIVNLNTGVVTDDSGTPGLVSGMVVTSQNAGDGWWRIICRRTSFSTTQGLNIKPGGTVGDGVSGIYLSSLNITPDDATTPQPYVRTTGTAYYGPRFDYAPNSGAARGLLIEDAITNDVSTSNILLGTNGTVSEGGSGLGGWVFSRYTADGTLSTHFATCGSVNPPALQLRRVQAIVRIVSGTRIQISVSTNHSSANTYMNIRDGSIVATGAGVSNGTIFDCGGGYYFIGFNYTTIAVTASGDAVVLYNITSDSDTRAPSNSSTDVIDMAFAMNAAASGYVSPILTTSGPVTKSSESLYLTVDSWLNQGLGTLYAEIIPGDSRDVLRRTTVISDGTTNNLYSHGISTSGAIQSHTVSGGAGDFTPSTPNTITPFVINKTVIKFNSPTETLCLNGGTIATSSATAWPTSGYTTMAVGCSSVGTTNRINSWIKEIRYYADTSASNAQLQSITT